MASNIVLYTGLFLVLATLVPLIRHDFWIFRVFEYPRLQKLTLTLVCFLITILFYFPDTAFEMIVSAGLLISSLYLIYQVYPFTIFGKKQVLGSRHPRGDNNISLLIANVYQENRESNDYHQLITKCDPDLILMVETNKWWMEQMDTIGDRYPYQLKEPLENTYGMLLYSRFKLSNGSVKYLVEDDIPSIVVDVSLPSGQLVKVYCLHPKPPVPQENPRSTERDKEILMVGLEAKDAKLPVIVMGDLNDVAWSYTTELFGKTSGLLDPRRGRGFFNSFNAKYPFLRFPLDHIFCSVHFSLTGIKRMERCGSDHFPMCVNLQYDPRMKSLNEKPTASQEEKELAIEKASADTDEN